MTAPSMRALRFVHPDLDVPSSGGPGLQHSPFGGLATVSGEDAVRQALLLLITTRPGERVNRPSYGCHLQRLLFASADDTIAGLAIHYVRRAVLRWEPRVELLEVDAVAHPGNRAELEITMSYRVRSTSATGSLSLAMPLVPGSGA